MWGDVVKRAIIENIRSFPGKESKETDIGWDMQLTGFSSDKLNQVTLYINGYDPIYRKGKIEGLKEKA